MGKICSVEKRIGFCEKWRASGLTQKVFCEQHGITTKSLSRWLRFEKNRQVKFLRIADVSNNETVEIILPNRIRIKIAAEKSFFVSLIKGLL